MSTLLMKLPTLVTSIYPRQLHPNPIVSITSTAQSAPSDIGGLFSGVCEHYREWMLISGRQLPPQWNMPDLLRFVIGDEAAQNPSLLTDYYYDVIMCGPRSWVCEAILEHLDLINYVL